uniref:NADH-ubiquinone oxidoreductase chain 3 n=2 Tax=Trichuris TaxID=36086 RepID=A0A0M4S7H8_TRITR|nr:NADH dehydrogenase subunit 3 [Trichuris sp. TTB1]ALF03958.1 NADH dehydrogenase subunit 3 [Trichuris trichiura]ATW73060.1 NADH dehydrogenase subunit 3 [Trichuris trichiura]ATW73072.1 NADH dehydrogenase subunit 3 [Trichuris trichiura]ATW73084.1 NADH dehydrogenase subunit 3 [Trichuris trichiura]
MVTLIFFTTLSISICCLMLFTRSLISKKELKEYLSYECGFESYKISRLPFSLNFFMLSIMFVLFDLEIIILIAMISSPVGLHLNTIVLGNMFLIFMLLTLFMEWSLNKLGWIF